MKIEELQAGVETPVAHVRKSGVAFIPGDVDALADFLGGRVIDGEVWVNVSPFTMEKVDRTLGGVWIKPVQGEAFHVTRDELGLWAQTGDAAPPAKKAPGRPKKPASE